MDNKTKGIVATIAAVLLCGCPGLFMCFFGATMAMAGMTPGAEIDVFGSSDPGAAMTMGFVFLCLSLIFIAIPIVVGFLMLRKKPEAAPVSDEPLPPAS
jgi:TRAP-type C4-dicarboxylate transport system permease small subunit